MKIKVNGMEVAEVDIKDLKSPNITYNINYEGCNFGTQYIGDEPLPQTQQLQLKEVKLGTLVDHIHEETGFQKEWIEIILKSISDYLKTENDNNDRR